MDAQLVNFIILQQQIIEKLEQAQFEQVRNEWTTDGGELEMSAKDATACDLLQN